MFSRSAHAFSLALALALPACGGKKLDRGEIEKVVHLADRCAMDNDLVGVLQAERRMAELARQGPDLGADDRAFLNEAVAKVDADVKTVEKAPPGRPHVERQPDQNDRSAH